MKLALPIDDHLPRLVEAAHARGLVLVAEPGAGKTTRLPRAMLEAGGEGQILVVEPRRLAARLAARRVAEELGEKVGQRVGYAVRFDRQGGARTRLWFLTHGMLLRRMLDQPTLPGVDAIVFDEIHERPLAMDLALACARRLQETRPLTLVAMSATVEPAPIADFLGGAIVEEVPGRTHPVEVEYEVSDRPLEQRVRAAVLRSLRERAGDVLVFLPGAAEIRRARAALEGPCKKEGVELLRLHGDLAPDEQDRVVRPRGDRRRVVLSTNVAESSVTVPGVSTVVDSGLARIARTSAAGLPSLRVERIAQAPAGQRAGRAGRTGPGHCVRLYAKSDFDARPLEEPPEIARLDLTEHRLALRVVADPELPLLDAPPAPAVEAADALLRDFGALDERGELTDHGHALAALPVHPRLGQVLLRARAEGQRTRGAWLAALLGERDVRREGDRGRVAASDVIERLLAVEAAEAEGLRDREMVATGLDPHAVRTVRRVARSLGRGARDDQDSELDEEALRQAILAGFPDRVARRRAPHSSQVVFAHGGAGELHESSAVREAEWMVATEVRDARERGGRGRTVVYQATAIEPEWLLESEARIEELDTLRFDAGTEQVERVTGLRYGALVLDESVTRDVHGDDVAACLAQAALDHGLEKLFDLDAIVGLERRLAFARRHGLPPREGDERLDALRTMALGYRSFRDLRRQSLVDAMLAGVDRGLLERIAPTHVSLPGRRRVPVTYEEDRDPWIASRLQDFFGLREGPRIARGAVPLVLHLQAPNRRAVQVTTDLANFWAEHYPALRKQLSRRYPKHRWPEDPA